MIHSAYTVHEVRTLRSVCAIPNVMEIPKTVFTPPTGSVYLCMDGFTVTRILTEKDGTE